MRTDDDLLYFHKSAAHQDYQNYAKNDPRVERSVTKAFVQRIAAGDYATEFGDEIESSGTATATATERPSMARAAADHGDDTVRSQRQ